MNSLPFWKVEIDSISGHVLSVNPATAEDATEHKYVFVVQEKTAKLAGRKAHKMYIASQRALRQSRRARYKAEGKCVDCGDPPKVGEDGQTFKHCQRCLDNQKAAKQRYTDRVAGKAVAPLPPKSVAFAETRQRRESTTRLELLEEVHRVWCHCKSEREFTEWLKSQLARARECTKGKAAA